MNYLDDIAIRIRREVEQENIPPDSDELFTIYALLALAKGNEVTEEDVHNAWSVWMSRKDPDHESLIPYAQLDSDIKNMDKPYVVAIRRVAKQL